MVSRHSAVAVATLSLITSDSRLCCCFSSFSSASSRLTMDSYLACTTENHSPWSHTWPAPQKITHHGVILGLRHRKSLTMDSYLACTIENHSPWSHTWPEPQKITHHGLILGLHHRKSLTMDSYLACITKNHCTTENHSPYLACTTENHSQ